MQTVRNRLIAAGLQGRRPAKKPFVSAKNRACRLKFAKEHELWTPRDWAKIVWSDESKINMCGSDGKSYVRRPVGTRFDPKYQLPTIKHGGGNVKVWGCFTRSGVGPICRVYGKMNRFIYRDILQSTMLPFARRVMSRGWSFQQDNDPKHTSKLVAKWFRTNKVKVLPWPAQSPDLAPIEHLWDEVKRRLRGQRFTNENALFEGIQAAWESIPTSTCEKLVDSMARRCAKVIENKGYSTKY